ncbi:hypothetical protein BDQ17DRAFT_1429357 [Cyathus striatus]|nr:hypothetical protein BDQ17DRAFT_1429357 [Cyathus striatus]
MNIIRDRRGIRKAFRNPSREIESAKPLHSIMIRDGTLYFFLIFVFALAETVASLDAKLEPYLPLPELIFPYYVAILSFSGSRLILDLKRMADLNLNGGHSAELSRSIFFAQPNPRSEEGSEPDEDEYITNNIQQISNEGGGKLQAKIVDSV